MVFRLRTNLNFVELRARLRSEHGPAHPKAQTDGALSDVDRDIEDCKAERNIRRACAFSISPIRTLPNEILLRIFDFSCDMNELTSKTVITMPALSIAMVCSRWRSLSRAEPALWSRVCLKIQSMSPNLPNFHILDLFLETSKQSPLTIEMTGRRIRDLGPRHLTVCSTLVAHAHLWKQLTVLHQEVYNHFPLLEALLLVAFFMHSPDILDRFQNASRLRSLSFAGFVFPLANLSQSRFVWNQLTLLKLSTHSAGMKTLLEMCGGLAELQLCEYNLLEGFYEKCTPPATTPALKTLSLTLRQTPQPESESLAEVVFTSMTCPALTSLLIGAQTDYKRLWPEGSLNDFISRSSFHLTTLSIKCIPLSESHLIDLLCRLPSLLDLTIEASGASDVKNPITPFLIRSLHALPPMNCAAPSSVLVPKLQKLDLSITGPISDGEEGEGEEIDDKDLIDMGYGQSTTDYETGTACLRSVFLRFKNRVINEETYMPIRYLEKAGLNVVLQA
ncbi:hypothetical protein BT96DRAFT_917328 [Gymnopus androsaceus JB14]|uniref:F-box domain-containing protein n=1 Tax=Gymnopus androsaceus JB14 TaxID=1447944 RepID=A0A6A4I1B2_9AGAR|nr:hypothetical protein BT96DRAFT_917328 [Gymnopus androsaceus JB14]